MKGEQLTDTRDETFFAGIKAVIRDEEGRVLLLEADSQFGPHWDLPGGKIHKNSTAENTLERELGEEIENIRISEISFLTADFSNINHLSSKKIIFLVYACEAVVGQINLSTEHLRYDWFPPGEAAKLLEFRFGKQISSKIAQL
jgi:8-oxo-dGTP pyrophosphatase MutT (NUDIX family)